MGSIVINCTSCGIKLKHRQYRVFDGLKYCYDCVREGRHKDDYVETINLPDIVETNPFLKQAKIEPIEETIEKIQLEGKTETLAEVVRQFEQLREIAVALGKKNDIYHVTRIDMYLGEVLDVITSPDAISGLTQNIIRTMGSGDLREIRALIQTVKDLAETKDLLSQSFDDGRGVGGQKRRMKLEVAFKNSDGTMVAAKAEV